MNLCPITYELCGQEKYSAAGIKLLSPGLVEFRDLPYSAEAQRQEATARAAKMSIQGAQPKLSARLDLKLSTFKVVDRWGHFILKPPNPLFSEVPQNEDLTMRLDGLAGIEVPFHGLCYAEDGSLTYFIKRFDRIGNRKKLAVEDFAQLTGQSRETKYNYSMERLADVLDKFCTFPVVEKVKLFKLTLFNFLTGNENMHLKNFSLISRDGKVELSPAYDLLNSTIAMRNAAEEMALPLGGKKRNLTRKLLVNYYGGQHLRLNKKTLRTSVESLGNVLPEWKKMIEISYVK